MDDTMEKLRIERKRKRRRFLLIFLTIGALFLCLSPWVSLIIGLLLAGTAAFGMSPYRNAYQGFRSSALLGGIASKTAKGIYSTETGELLKRSAKLYFDMIFMVAMGMSLFAASLISMAFGWNGLVVLYF